MRNYGPLGPLGSGDRVQTPDGPGTIKYLRMEPPDYSKPAVYSVALDHKVGTNGYTGSIYAADKVTGIK